MTSNRVWHASIYAVCLIFQLGLAFVSSLISARVLEPELFGISVLLRNVYQTILIVAPLGLDLALQRFVSQGDDRSEEMVLQTQRLRLVVYFSNLLVVAAISLLIGGWLERDVYRFDGFNGYLTVMLFTLPFAADMMALGGFYRARGNPLPFYAASLFLQPVVKLAVMLGFFHIGCLLEGVVVSTLIGTMIPSVLLSLHQAHTYGWSLRFLRARVDELGEIGHIFRTSIWMSMSALLYSLMRFVDVLVLGIFVPASVVGTYGLLSMFAQLVSIFPSALSQNLGPDVARCFQARDFARMKQIVDSYIRKSTILASFVFGGVVFFGSSLDIVIDSKYDLNGAITLILPLGYLVSATLSPTGFMLSMTGRHKKEFAILFLSGVLLTVACWILVPLMGAVGAATSVVVSYIFANVYRFIQVARVMHFVPGRLADLRIVLYSIFIGFGANLVENRGIGHDALGLSVAIVVYCLLYVTTIWKFELSTVEREKLKAWGRRKFL